MFDWLLTAAETLALGLQDALPARMRGLERMTDAIGARKGQVVQWVLPEASVLEQTLELPNAAGPGWLAARVEAISPWEKDACLWDAKIAGRSVRLAIVPRQPVLAAEEALKVRGARLAEVVAGEFRFRRDAAQVRRWRDRIALGVGLGTVLALALAGLGTSLATQAGDRAAVADAALQRSAARLKEGAGPAQAALALLPRKGASVALALSRLAGALPQDSYLTTLSVTVDGFEISGQTAKPEAIIPALTADPGFAAVDFAGPAAHDAETGSYSFTIRGKMVTP